MKYLISFRSSLNICNYTCWYCPWAGTFERYAPEKVQADAEKIDRIVQRLLSLTSTSLALFFVPRAEFLILPHYRQAIAQLSQAAHLQHLTVQTNLSFPLLPFLQQIKPDKVRLWITYHPDQLPKNGSPLFLEKIRLLQEWGVTFSVGAVGVKENLPAIQRLRADLSPEIYLWINGYKREKNYYTEEELAEIERIDPFFKTHFISYDSYGKPCNAGFTSVFLEETGVLRRCNFIEEPIGSLFEDDWEKAFQPRLCSKASCSCYQGLMQIPELNFENIYGDYKAVRLPLPFQKKSLSF